MKMIVTLDLDGTCIDGNGNSSSELIDCLESLDAYRPIMAISGYLVHRSDLLNYSSKDGHTP